MKKERLRKTIVFKIAEQLELLVEAVKRSSVLRDRRITFKDNTKKNLALDDVAKLS